MYLYSSESMYRQNVWSCSGEDETWDDVGGASGAMEGMLNREERKQGAQNLVKVSV